MKESWKEEIIENFNEIDVWNNILINMYKHIDSENIKIEDTDMKSLFYKVIIIFQPVYPIFYLLYQGFTTYSCLQVEIR